MPVLGPDFLTFERANNDRQRLVEAKERSAAKLAHGLLETDSQPTKVEQVKRYVGAMVTGRQAPEVRRQTPLAFYEPDAESAAAGEISMAAYFSNVSGGCLFTRPVRPGAKHIEERLGPLQPRAIIRQDGYHGYPVVALDEAGYEVLPSTMSIDDRETFIDQVSETLTIINAQLHAKQAEPRAPVHVRGYIIP